MTATTPGPAVVTLAEQIIAEHGAFPAGALNERTLKKQSTRLLKCECAQCGYVARVTAKWIDQCGAPICPGMPGEESDLEEGEEVERESHGPMTVAGGEEGEGEG